MRVDPSQQYFKVIEGNKVQITSKRENRTITTVHLDPSFIKKHLPGTVQREDPDLVIARFSSIDKNGIGTTACNISKRQLQLAVDQEEMLRGEAVVQGVSKGDPETGALTITELPADRSSISVRFGPTLKDLLTEGPISDDHRGKAIIEAINRWRPSLVRQLLEDGPISEKHFKDALKKAVDMGHLEIVTLLLAKRSLSEQEWGSIVIKAAENGYSKIVTEFLASGRISEQDRGTAVKLAAQNRHLDIMKQLLSDGPISQEDREDALWHAAANGDTKIVTELLSNGPISEKARGEGVRIAANSGYAEIVTALLSDGPISEKARGTAVRHAAKSNHAEIVIQLLADGPILEEDRKEAVANAIENEDVEIIRILINGAFSEAETRTDLIHLASIGDEQMLRLLLAVVPPQILANIRGAAVIEAAKNGYVGFVTQLLGNGTMSEQDRGEAVRIAANNGYAEIVTALLSDGPISEQDRGEAVRIAANSGYAEIVTALLSDGPISEQDRAEAVAIARGNGHPEIVTLLGGEPEAPPISTNRFYIKIDDFAENPQFYLARVAEEGLKPVTFINPDGKEQPGIDAGGLTKQFVCQLCEHLILKGILETDDLRYPSSNKQDLTPYKQLGQLLSHIDEKNATRTDPLYIGEIFAPETYLLLQILAADQSEGISPEQRKEHEFLAIANVIGKGFKKPLVDFLNNPDPLEEDITAIKRCFEELQGSPLTEPIDIQGIRAACFESLGLEQYHRALSAILSGLSTALKGKILAQGLDIAKSLQGEVNDRLLGKFVLAPQTPPAIAQKLTWIKDKITEELTDPEKAWIKRFLKAVTGQSVIPGGVIEIRQSSDNLCRAHTCFCQLDLPTDEMSKDLFFERLELLMADPGFGIT